MENRFRGKNKTPAGLKKSRFGSFRRALALLLCVCMMTGVMVFTFAEGTEPEARGVADAGFVTGYTGPGLCEHHPEHDDTCGYVEAVEGAPCTHAVHDWHCYEIWCVHVHGENCYSDQSLPAEGEAKTADACRHVHDERCYALNCPHTHGDGCYVLQCAHQHDGGCYDIVCVHRHDDSCYTVAGWNEDGEEELVLDCTHTHGADCEVLNCGHVHGDECRALQCAHAHDEGCYILHCPHESDRHDETCGFAQAVAGHPCEHYCEICAGDNSGEDNGDNDNGETGDGDDDEEDGIATVVGWTWVDTADALQPSPSNSFKDVAWMLEAADRSDETLLAVLPAAISATLKSGEQIELPVIWDLENPREYNMPIIIPQAPGKVEEPSYYLYTAALPEGYALGKDAENLTVLVKVPEEAETPEESENAIVTGWSWVDPEEALRSGAEYGMEDVAWVLEAANLSEDTLLAALPAEISATLESGEETVLSVIWDLENPVEYVMPAAEEEPAEEIAEEEMTVEAPAEAAETVCYIYTAALPGGYVLGEGAEALCVLVRTAEEAADAVVTDWSWVDPEEALRSGAECGMEDVAWVLETADLSEDALLSVLPAEISATLESGEEAVLSVIWDLENPVEYVMPAAAEESAEEDPADEEPALRRYIYTAELPEGYVLDEGAEALCVLVQEVEQTYVITDWAWVDELEVMNDIHEMEFYEMFGIGWMAALPVITQEMLTAVMPSEITVTLENGAGIVDGEDAAAPMEEAEEAGVITVPITWNYEELQPFTLPLDMLYGEEGEDEAEDAAMPIAVDVPLTEAGDDSETEGDATEAEAAAMEEELHLYLLTPTLPENYVLSEDADSMTTLLQGNLIMTLAVSERVEEQHKVKKHIVDPPQTTINLFDYWLTNQQANDYQVTGDFQDNWWNNDGVFNNMLGAGNKGIQNINTGHLLIFAGYWATENADNSDNEANIGTWNKWTDEDQGKGGKPCYEIVQNKLVGEYPALNVGKWGSPNNSVLSNLYNNTPGKKTESLAYLFDDSGHAGKMYYPNITGLFRLKQNGYYYFDSKLTFAELNIDQPSRQKTSKGSNGENKITLYDARWWINDSKRNPDNGQFFPFNDWSNLFSDSGNGNVRQNNDTIANQKNTTEPINHYLGMTITTQFRQPVNGMVNRGSDPAVPMTFEFEGDDDVWVFIDGVLVADIGGIHLPSRLVIDFSTGKITINGGKTNDTTGKETTLYEMYDDAKALGRTKWDKTGTTFANYSKHELKFFYLERGNDVSNCLIQFNFKDAEEDRIIKVDQDGDVMTNTTFDLIDTSGAEEVPIASGIKFTPDPDDPIGGYYPIFSDEDGDIIDFTDYDGRTLTLREVETPEGYKTVYPDIELLCHLNSNKECTFTVTNREATGAYASARAMWEQMDESVQKATGLNGDGSLIPGAVLGEDEQQIKELENGLAIVVPLYKNKAGVWMPLYGSNTNGWHSITSGNSLQDVAKAALLQIAATDSTRDWYMTYNRKTQRFEANLDNIPGNLNRYGISSEKDPVEQDLTMMTIFLTPAALQSLGVTETYDNDDDLFAALKEALGTQTEETVGAKVAGINNSNAYYIYTDHYWRAYRTVIYVPNEQRELRVRKLDEEGNPVTGAVFALFNKPEEAQQARTNFKDKESALKYLQNLGDTVEAFGVTADGVKLNDEAGTKATMDGLLIFREDGTDNNYTDGIAKMMWATRRKNTEDDQFWLKEIYAPTGYKINPNIVRVEVGNTAIYANATAYDKNGTWMGKGAKDGIQVVGSLGKLYQTLTKLASDNSVDVTLQDITIYRQTQPGNTGPELVSGKVKDTPSVAKGWDDTSRAPADKFNLHYRRNDSDYTGQFGLHYKDEADAELIKTLYEDKYPAFVEDDGYIRAMPRQTDKNTRNSYNGSAMPEGGTFTHDENAKRDDLGTTDLDGMFTLINTVLVRDVPLPELEIQKKVVGGSDPDAEFDFEVELTIPATEIPADENNVPVTTLTLHCYKHAINHGCDPDEDHEHGKGNCIDVTVTIIPGTPNCTAKIPKGTFKLKNNEAFVITGLPEGTTYKVTETLPEGSSYDTSIKLTKDIGSKDPTELSRNKDEREVSGELFKWELPGGGSDAVYMGPGDDGVQGTGDDVYQLPRVQVVYTNETPPLPDLEIEKEVTGDNPDLNAVFKFDVTLTIQESEVPTDDQGEPVDSLTFCAYKHASDHDPCEPDVTHKHDDGEGHTHVTFALKNNDDGTYTATLSSPTSIELKHNETFVILDLPNGTEYVITEEVPADGEYDTTITVGSNPVEDAQNPPQPVPAPNYEVDSDDETNRTVSGELYSWPDDQIYKGPGDDNDPDTTDDNDYELPAVHVIYTNDKRPLPDLEIEKKVIGDKVDPNAEFTFDVKLTMPASGLSEQAKEDGEVTFHAYIHDSDHVCGPDDHKHDDGENGHLDVTFALTDKGDGTYTATLRSPTSITLKHGQTLVILDMPNGTKYEITETAGSDYRTTIGVTKDYEEAHEPTLDPGNPDEANRKVSGDLYDWTKPADRVQTEGKDTTETDDDVYVLPTVHVTYTNERYLPDLEIEKEVTGDVVDENAEFTFDVELAIPKDALSADTTSPLTYCAYIHDKTEDCDPAEDHKHGNGENGHLDVTFDLTTNADGSYTAKLNPAVKLKHNETIVILDLPNGTTYTITETLPTGNDYYDTTIDVTKDLEDADDPRVTEKNEAERTVTGDLYDWSVEDDRVLNNNGTESDPSDDFYELPTVHVTYTNEIRLPSLEIEKEVTGDGDKNAEFEFNVTLTIPATGLSEDDIGAEEVTFHAYLHKSESCNGTGADHEKHVHGTGSEHIEVKFALAKNGENYTATLTDPDPLKLKHGWTLVILGLPNGTSYVITEDLPENDSDYDTTITVSSNPTTDEDLPEHSESKDERKATGDLFVWPDDKATVGEGDDATTVLPALHVKYTNNKLSQTALEIEKWVPGGVDTETAFPFNVELTIPAAGISDSDKNPDGTITYHAYIHPCGNDACNPDVDHAHPGAGCNDVTFTLTENPDGSFKATSSSIELKHGQTIVFPALPTGTTYSIKEDLSSFTDRTYVTKIEVTKDVEQAPDPEYEIADNDPCAVNGKLYADKVQTKGDDTPDDPEDDEFVMPTVHVRYENGLLMDLPATGGRGTTLYMLLGGLLILSGLAVLIPLYTRRRRFH